MRKQIEKFVNNCRTCTQCKHGPVPKACVQDHRHVEKLFETISIDITCMPLSLKGNQNFLLVTDNLSKLSTAVSLSNAHASTDFITLDPLVWALWYSEVVTV